MGGLACKHANAIQHPRPEKGTFMELHVDQTELAIHEVVVELQALAFRWPDSCLVVLPPQRERSARLENGEHANKSLLDAVALGDLASQILLSRRLAQVLV